MTALKDSLDNLTLSGDISSRWPRFKLKWVENAAGFDIFDLTDAGGGKLGIGDNADYLHLFMAMAEKVYQPGQGFEPLLVASDTGGTRLFVRYYTTQDKERFKYAYIALGNAVKQLPEGTINDQLSFFAEITKEEASGEGFEKEARKAARTMEEDIREAWETLIDNKHDFLKTDLYVFHLLKLYSWGFQTVGKEKPAADYHFVRAKRPVARGTSRH